MQIGHAVSDLLTGADDSSWKTGKLHSCLFWINYRTLLKVERRDFYEIEAIKNNWSARALERQINSLRWWAFLFRKGLIYLTHLLVRAYLISKDSQRG
ncbi:MAG: hypothetical protein KAH31_00395 [Candidatus Sabulitectum sp.]|nr:hypothetical protein [Candidatus Sabulitectum sp.]